MGRRNYNAYETDGSGGGFRSDNTLDGRQQQRGAGIQGWGTGYQGTGNRGEAQPGK